MSNNKGVTVGMSGWAKFAGYLMVIAGIFQSIAGLAAIFKNEVYVVGQENLVVFDYTQWGWIHLLIGLILIVSAMSLFSGQLWGRTVAIVLATFSAIANFAFIQAYPLWAITIIVLNILIIFGVAKGYDGIEE